MNMNHPIRIEKIDPKDYPFRHHIEKYKHLDTDADRHKIKVIAESIDEHYKGKEHLYCDKDQLDSFGNFRKPKIVIEAESMGYTSVMEYCQAKFKSKENDTQQIIKNQSEQIKELQIAVARQNELLQKLMNEKQ